MSDCEVCHGMVSYIDPETNLWERCQKCEDQQYVEKMRFLEAEAKTEKKVAVKRLIEAQRIGDREIAHVKADDVLCDLLDALGYADVVEEYEKVDKWYA